MKMVKGDRISYSIIAIHRNEKFWDRPDVFDPDRWLDSGILKVRFVISTPNRLRILGFTHS